MAAAVGAGAGCRGWVQQYGLKQDARAGAIANITLSGAAAVHLKEADI